MREHVNSAHWMWRVVSWDTLLPAFVWVAPYIIELAFPRREGLIEAAAVALPIAAFFLRIHAGRRQIAIIHCADSTRRLQRIVLIIGVCR